MLKFIPAEDNVFAVEVARKITGEDLDAILDRLEPMLEQHDKVHILSTPNQSTASRLQASPATRPGPCLFSLS